MLVLRAIHVPPCRSLRTVIFERARTSWPFLNVTRPRDDLPLVFRIFSVSVHEAVADADMAREDRNGGVRARASTRRHDCDRATLPSGAMSDPRLTHPRRRTGST